MRLPKRFFGLLGPLAISPALAAEEPPRWITEGPFVEEAPFAFEVPLETLGDMLFVDVAVHGEAHRFLFDTGSPSMMSAALAAELGLEVIDTRRGKDSHGTVIETDVVQADFVVGGATFYKVPVFVTDFPKPPRCLFDGVLGSEVLPLCAWQIDLPDGVLRCSSELAKLDHVAKATQQPLYDFGYPHAPFFDVQFARNARSKAMFDTGSPGYFTISPADFEGARRNGGVGKTVPGRGSIGGSIGGPSPAKDQLLVELESLTVGNARMGRVDSLQREFAPSLIGSSLLRNFIVTLDTKSSSAYFEQYRDGPFVRPSYGFGLSFDDPVSISLVWDQSPAAAAGLRVGQRVTSIGGRPASTSCDGVRDTIRAMSEGDAIELQWEGGSTTLTREKPIRDTE